MYECILLCMNKNKRASYQVLIILSVIFTGLLFFAIYLYISDDKLGAYLMMGSMAIFVPIIVWAMNVDRKAFFVHEKILKIGISGQAKILNSTQTGLQIQGQPHFILTLGVTIPNQEPYTVKQKFMIPLAILSRIQVGMIIPVKVDPKDHNKDNVYF